MRSCLLFTCVSNLFDGDRCIGVAFRTEPLNGETRRERTGSQRTVIVRPLPRGIWR